MQCTLLLIDILLLLLLLLLLLFLLLLVEQQQHQRQRQQHEPPPHLAKSHTSSPSPLMPYQHSLHPTVFFFSDAGVDGQDRSIGMDLF